MRRSPCLLLLGAIAIGVPGAACARAPSATVAAAPAAAPMLPAGVVVRPGKVGFHYADARGMTLYALNQRIARSRSGGISPYCIGPCTKVWTEFAAAADAKPIGDWTIVRGQAGTQWAYRNNPVFLFAADRAPGDTGGDQYDDLWNVIVHVPPPPPLTAPAVVTPLYAKGAYVLADPDGRALFVPTTTCAGTCDDWQPLLAGMAARAVGVWAVARSGTGAHWTYRGKPVFVSQDADTIPVAAQVLRP